jgi:hypothetical protein
LDGAFKMRKNISCILEICITWIEILLCFGAGVLDRVRNLTCNLYNCESLKISR